jgi:putative oxidoreductase
MLKLTPPDWGVAPNGALLPAASVKRGSGTTGQTVWGLEPMVATARGTAYVALQVWTGWMEITVVELLVPAAPSTPAQAALLVLRLFMGVCFIRHGWPKLRNLDTWAQALNTPRWLCFLSAFSMWGAGIALIPGLLTPLAALAILVSMAYAMVLEIRSGFPFIAPDPYQIPAGDYAGPMGVGDPPSWEKAAMYVVMCLVLMACGGGLFSLDNLLIADLLMLALG